MGASTDRKREIEREALRRALLRRRLIQGAGNSINHPATPEPTTEAEVIQLRRAQDKRDRRAHRRGAVTVMEGSE